MQNLDKIVAGIEIAIKERGKNSLKRIIVDDIGSPIYPDGVKLFNLLVPEASLFHLVVLYRTGSARCCH